MGNTGSNGAGGRRRANDHAYHHDAPHPPPPPPPPPVPPPQQHHSAAGNRYVFAASTPYPPQYPNPNPPGYYQYAGYYPQQPPTVPVPLPAPFDHHHRPAEYHHNQPPSWPPASYPCPPLPQVPAAPYIEHQKAVTIRNDINIKKETLRVEADAENPGKFLVAFGYDATVAGRITVIFFAEEGFDCNLSSVKGNLLRPVTVEFNEGLGQKFRQPSGTGIDFSVFEECELVKENEMEVYPLAIKAEASPSHQESTCDNENAGTPNSQITQAVFEKKENGEYQVRVVKQILWVGGTRYELQEIFGIGNSVDNDLDGNDPGKECVICLSEPRDTTVLPCRHMCMCSQCAKVLRFQTNRCPICRQPVERLLEIKVNNRADEKQ